MDKIIKPELKIYVDGELDIKQTYVPVIKKQLWNGFDRFNDWFIALYE